MIMKKYIAIATMAMALAGCSQDENGGMHDGMEPMVLTAQGTTPQPPHAPLSTATGRV